MTQPYLVILVIGLVACVFDLRTRRIPNVLTFSTAGAGLIYHFMIGGWSGAGGAAAGLLLGLLIFFPLFALRGLGAGDLKLLAAFGAWLGPQRTLMAALAAAIFGAAAALILVFFQRRISATASNLHDLVTFWKVAGPRPHPELTLETSPNIRLAYAVPITAGALATLWFR
jgi:prepilin peptidase CpaA